MLSLLILRYYKSITSALNSALLHQQTDYKCPAMSDCPYTGKTLLEKRKLPLLPPTLDKIWELSDQNKDGFLDRYEFTVASHLAVRAVVHGDEIPDLVVITPHQTQ